MIHARAYVEDSAYRAAQGLTLIDTPERAPVVAQICVRPGETDIALEALNLLVKTTVIAVDLNLGCPQTNAAKHCYGAYLPVETAADTLTAMCAQKNIPITAKIRVAESLEETKRCVDILLKTGISALTIHGRTKEQIQGNTGLPDWGILREICGYIKARSGCTVFCNGGVVTREDVSALMDTTKCDGVMSAEALLWDFTLFDTKQQHQTLNGRLIFSHSNPSVLAHSLTNARTYLHACTTHPPTLYQLAMHLRKLLFPCITKYPFIYLQHLDILPDPVDPRICSITPGSEMQLQRGITIWEQMVMWFTTAEETTTTEGEETLINLSRSGVVPCMVAGLLGEGRLVGVTSEEGLDINEFEQALDTVLSSVLEEGETVASDCTSKMRVLEGSNGGARPMVNSVVKLSDVCESFYKKVKRTMQKNAPNETNDDEEVPSIWDL